MANYPKFRAVVFEGNTLRELSEKLNEFFMKEKIHDRSISVITTINDHRTSDIEVLIIYIENYLYEE
jgi:hypothetical protein